MDKGYNDYNNYDNVGGYDYYPPEPVKKNNTTAIIIAVAVAAVVITGVVVALIFVLKGNNSGGTPPVNNNITPPAVQTTSVQQTEQENYAPVETQAQNNLPPAIPPKNPPSPPANVRPNNNNNNNNSGNPDYSEGILNKNQRNLNLFISNFTECGMTNFTGIPKDKELVDFAFRYYYINTKNDPSYSYLERTDYDEYLSNFKIEEGNIIKNMKKYFGVTKPDGFFGNNMTTFCKGYDNGYFYFYCDQLLPGGFAVVKNVEASGNTYYCKFDIYSVDNEFPSMEANEPYYGINANKANSYVRSGALTGMGSGTAQITASNINDRSTYKLTGYNVDYTY